MFTECLVWTKHNFITLVIDFNWPYMYNHVHVYAQFTSIHLTKNWPRFEWCELGMPCTLLSSLHASPSFHELLKIFYFHLTYSCEGTQWRCTHRHVYMDAQFTSIMLSQTQPCCSQVWCEWEAYPVARPTGAGWDVLPLSSHQEGRASTLLHQGEGSHTLKEVVSMVTRLI